MSSHLQIAYMYTYNIIINDDIICMMWLLSALPAMVSIGLDEPPHESK